MVSERRTAARRAIPTWALVTGLTMVGACGPDAPSPIPGPGPGPPMFQTTVRVVSALGEPLGLPDVVLTVANGVEQRTDAAGRSVIRAESPGSVSLRLAHPSFIGRETAVRVPDDRVVDLSLIPSTHDLAAFEEFSPRTAGLRRWTRNPRLLVLTHAVDFSRASLGFLEYPVIDRPVSRAQLDCLSAGVAAALPEMSGGHLTWDAVEIADVEPGTSFRTDQTPEGTIVVLPSVSLGTAGRGIGYVATEPFTLSRGAVWITAEMMDYCLISLLYRHELGHALGYLHVTRTLSIMSMGLPPGLTEFDRNSIAILFQRRPGNFVPDRDPAGISVNVTGGAARHGIEPMR